MRTLNVGSVGNSSRHQHLFNASSTLDLNGGDFQWDLNRYPYPFADNTWDLVFCSHTLEHLDNPQKALTEIVRISKEALIYVPHRWSKLGRCDKRSGGHKNTFTTLWFCRVLNQLPVVYSVNLSWNFLRPLDLKVEIIKTQRSGANGRSPRA